jgi:hypothetical protein
MQSCGRAEIGHTSIAHERSEMFVNVMISMKHFYRIFEMNGECEERSTVALSSLGLTLN